MNNLGKGLGIGACGIAIAWAIVSTEQAVLVWGYLFLAFISNGWNDCDCNCKCKKEKDEDDG